MAFIVGALVGGGAIYRASHSNHSAHGNHANYSDSAERMQKKREAKQRELAQSKQRLQNYVDIELERLITEYNLTQNSKKWHANEASFQSFSNDYGKYHTKVSEMVKEQLENQLKNDISEDEQAIRDIDAIILRINQIQLTCKGAQN